MNRFFGINFSGNGGNDAPEAEDQEQERPDPATLKGPGNVRVPLDHEKPGE